MGRYWNTTTGRSGKFMFGVQPSNAPEGLGMHEQERTSISYYADEDDKEEIKTALNGRYSLLGVPEGERVYTLPEDYGKWRDKVLVPLVFDTIPEDQAPKGAKLWASRTEGCVDIEKDPMRTKWYSDIYLALTILTDIEEQGVCELEAEL